MTCTIDWNSLNLSEWESRFFKARRAPLLQSYAYARAACGLHGQKARWGLIRLAGREAGLVQVLEAGLAGNLLHTVQIDRGPVWFEGFDTQQHFELFLDTLARAFPPRPGRARRFIPEIEDNSNIKELLLKHGFRQKSTGYQTLWLDLSPSSEKLRAALKPGWAGALRKAERAGLGTCWSCGPGHLAGLLAGYARDRREKGYPGPPVKLLRALAAAFEKNMVIGRALGDNGEACGAVMLLRHGSCATYQLGWTTAEGRAKGAQNLLLWEALGVLKNMAVRDFDLGGVNDETAAGVKAFKSGMGGALATLPGLYG